MTAKVFYEAAEKFVHRDEPVVTDELAIERAWVRAQYPDAPESEVSRVAEWIRRTREQYPDAEFQICS